MGLCCFYDQGNEISSSILFFASSCWCVWASQSARQLTGFVLQWTSPRELGLAPKGRDAAWTSRLARVPSPRYCWSSRHLAAGSLLLGPKVQPPEWQLQQKFEPRPGKRSSASPPSRYLELVLGEMYVESPSSPLIYKNTNKYSLFKS